MRPRAAAFALLAAVGCLAPLAAQYRWTRHVSTPSPVGRRHPALVYDAARGVTVLFGGFRGAYVNDMWTFDGTRWREVFPIMLPTPRAMAAVAYDPLREKVVLMGGTDGTTLTDVWEWDGTDWAQVATGQTLLQTEGSAAFDPALGGVLFNIDTTNLVWNGSSWRSLSVSRPDGGRQHVLVYDPTSAGIMTQVGSTTKRFVSGGGWQEVLVSFGWSVRNYAMAVDPATGRMALTGGRTGQGNVNTSIWLGSSWWTVFQYDVGPAEYEHGAMVFDLARGVYVHFGGVDSSQNYNNSTWVLSEVPLPRAAYAEFGAGCGGGTTYQPALHADLLLGARPILGGSLTLQLERMPPTQPVIGWYGASRTAWGSVPLPLDLLLLSMPGCSLLAAPDAVVPLGSTSASGTARWQTSIPNTAALAGQQFFQQTAVFAPGANAPGLLWSNAGEGTIGVR